MTTEIAKQVWSLEDIQALDACAALATFLEVELDLEEGKLDTSNFNQLLASATNTEKSLHQDLKSVNPTNAEAAEAARSMLLLVADLGFAEQVEMAISAAQEHGRDFGVISGPLLLAGLAVVLSYVPVEQRSKVHKIHYRGPDGSEREEEITETETIRVGAAAVEKLASWWKVLIGG
jgi:hypothetical protein